MVTKCIMAMETKEDNGYKFRYFRSFMFGSPEYMSLTLPSYKKQECVEKMFEMAKGEEIAYLPLDPENIRVIDLSPREQKSLEYTNKDGWKTELKIPLEIEYIFVFDGKWNGYMTYIEWADKNYEKYYQQIEPVEIYHLYDQMKLSNLTE